MPTVQSVGNADYQMPIQNQSATDAIYANEPEIYDPEIEEKKAAAGSKKGMTALGIIAAAGLGIAAWKAHSASKYEKLAKTLEEENAKLKDQLNDRTGAVAWFKRPLVALWDGCVKCWNWIKGLNPFKKGKKVEKP